MEPRFDAPLLVTGGAGLIGSAIVWELNRFGFDDVVVCDILDRSEKWKNLAPLRFREYMEATNVVDRVEREPAWLDQFGTILHLGACSATTELDGAYLVRNNYGFTKMLAEAAVTRGVRFVYASSAATYGALEHDLCEQRSLETLRPLNIYAYSKHLFDQYAERSDMLRRIAGLKYFNVYGPNEAHKGEMRSVVAKAFETIEAHGCVRLFKSYRGEFCDGGQLRDFIYVKDAVRMTLTLAADPKATGLFNIGSGDASTWLELAHAVFAALDLAPRIEFVEMPDAIRQKYQYRTQASIERARSFGAVPRFALEAGVDDYIRRYLATGQHLDPLVPEPERELPSMSRTQRSGEPLISI